MHTGLDRIYIQRVYLSVVFLEINHNHCRLSLWKGSVAAYVISYYHFCLTLISSYLTPHVDLKERPFALVCCRLLQRLDKFIFMEENNNHTNFWWFLSSVALFFRCYMWNIDLTNYIRWDCNWWHRGSCRSCWWLRSDCSWSRRHWGKCYMINYASNLYEVIFWNNSLI